MKNIKKTLIISILLSLSSSSLFGYVGNSLVPPWQAYVINSHALVNVATYSIFLSNISESEIDIELFLFDSDGSILKDSDNNENTGLLRASGYFTNYSEQSDASLVVKVAAGKSVELKVNPFGMSGDLNYWGYGKIIWTSSEPIDSAVIARGMIYRTLGDARATQGVQINNGLPF
ncbi:MAG: hypothetical protein MI748_02975 [Opitutales bacterium]|nr:hypothetical protein [Opitutales bacterium]